MRLAAGFALPLLVGLGSCVSHTVTGPDGWRQLGLNDYPGALVSFDQALERENDAKHHAGRARALFQLRRLRDSELSFDQAIKLDPSNPQWLIGRSVVRLAQSNPFGAVQDCDAALTIDPTIAKAHFNRGLANLAAQQDEQAYTDFSRAIELQPRFAAAYNSRGIVLVKAERLSEAIENFRAAASLDQALANAHSNLGAAQYAQGNVQQAFVSLNTAIRIDRRVPSFFVNRGHIYLDLGQSEQAALDFEQALVLTPNDQHLRTLLAEAEGLSDRQKAQREAGFDRDLHSTPSD